MLLVIDVSGSMGEPAGGAGDTKLDLAKRAATSALSDFKDDDEVGLRVFTTGIRNVEPSDYLDLVPIGRIGDNRRQIDTAIQSLEPQHGTPLYTVAQASYDALRQDFDPTRINAVVLLTDGKNEDDRNPDVNALLTRLRNSNEGEATPGAHLHHRLRQGRRPGRPPAHRGVDQRGGVRRQRPDEHQPGVHGRHLQLLT